MRLRPFAAVLAIALVAAAAPAAHAADPPEGATWSETYLDTPDGERLHADVLRPDGISPKQKTPVILVVSPYLGMTAPDEQPGPSNRFYDFFEGAKVFERGYSVVMVSLRGTGGSSGCLDILGPGEQTDVVTAVKWASRQRWSTGRVGMYGKSYDANTGVVGAALRPAGLKAVVAQEVVPDRYRGSYNQRVRFLQSLAFPSATYGAGGEGTFSLYNDGEYQVNSLSHSADCQAHFAGHYDDDATNDFWRSRDFVTKAKGSTVPTFLTTGFLDANTNPGGGSIEFFEALRGPKRMWIGWWDHVRGNDRVGDRLAMGRAGFFDEVMRFLDRHVKGIPVDDAGDPVIAAQGTDGTWRSEAAWPPADAQTVAYPLLAGSYADDGRNLGALDTAAGPGGTLGNHPPALTGHGSWTFTKPLRRPVHVAGVPRATVDLAPAAPRTNLVVNVYDVAPDGNATMVSRGAHLADAAGPAQVKLFPLDWTFAPGHRIGLLVSGANSDAYTHVPTQTTATVRGGSVDLPTLGRRRTSDLEGAPAPRLEQWKTDAPFAVPAATIAQRTA